KERSIFHLATQIAVFAPPFQKISICPHPRLGLPANFLSEPPAVHAPPLPPVSKVRRQLRGLYFCLSVCLFPCFSL
ncbi:hypothetical protein LY76DRAFT_684493, partial [Colletotrichum caudatum]